MTPDDISSVAKQLLEAFPNVGLIAASMHSVQRCSAGEYNGDDIGIRSAINQTIYGPTVKTLLRLDRICVC